MSDKKISRVEVIGTSKRLLTLRFVHDVEQSIQDDGRTLKIFLRHDEKGHESIESIREKAREESYQFVSWFIQQENTIKRTNTEWIDAHRKEELLNG